MGAGFINPAYSSHNLSESMLSNQKLAMPWADYVNSLSEPTEANRIQEAFSLVEGFIAYLGGQFGLIGDLPSIYAETSRGVCAECRKDKIVISRGLIDFYGEHTLPPCDVTSIPVSLASLLSQGSMSHTALLWTAAHEFFHYARGHAYVLRENSNVWPAIEFDADCIATAALYRYLRISLPKSEIESLSIKLLVLNSIFWPLRTLMQDIDPDSAVPVKHLSWYSRLYYVVDKLSSLDVPHPNFGSTPEWHAHLNSLSTEAIRLDRAYPSSNCRFIDFLRQTVRGEIFNPIPAILQMWETEAEPLVRKYSRLLPEHVAAALRNSLPPGSHVAIALVGDFPGS